MAGGRWHKWEVSAMAACQSVSREGRRTTQNNSVLSPKPVHMAIKQ
jgi:hypothetical protein